MNVLKTLERKARNIRRKVTTKTRNAAKAVRKTVKATGTLGERAVNRVARTAPVIGTVTNAVKTARDLRNGASLKEAARGAAKRTRVGRTVNRIAKNAKNIGKAANAARNGDFNRALRTARQNPIVQGKLKQARELRERSALLEHLKEPSRLLNPKTRKRDLKTVKRFLTQN